MRQFSFGLRRTASAHRRISHILWLGFFILVSVSANGFAVPANSDISIDSDKQSNSNDLIRTPFRLAQIRKPTDHSISTVSQKIKKRIAKKFGLSVSEVNDKTNLVEDLYADPMDVYELLSVLCDQFSVRLPEGADLNTVGEITDYILVQMGLLTKGKSATRGIGGSTTRALPSPRAAAEKALKDPIFIQKIFYATDRGLTRSHQYGGGRALSDQASYGMCEVSIPVNVHKRGHLERPSLLSLEWKEDSKKHIVLKKVEQLPWDGFLGRLKGKLSATDGNAFVFIHGFNVSFDQGARRTAQIAYDLDFNGAPIMFSWPSNASMLGYLSDREDVEWAVPHIEQFLTDVLAKAKVKKMHLIAHSMGNQGLIRALHKIALRRGESKEPLFENVILAAPDFDAQVFTDHVAPEIITLAKRWTLYSSDKDTALDASSALRSDVQRLGIPLSVAKGVDTIDATGISVTPWSVPEFHSYYASKQRVIQDVIGVLRGLGPIERQLRQKVKERLLYWEL